MVVAGFTVYGGTEERELGRRYLKLGNTYRENGNGELSIKYLNKGYSIVKKYSDFYWIAVAEEYLGYYYKDRKEYGKALKYLRSAKAIYDVYGKLRNGEGSNKAVEKAIESIESEAGGNDWIPGSGTGAAEEKKEPVKKEKKSVKAPKKSNRSKIIPGKLPRTQAEENMPRNDEIPEGNVTNENIRIGDPLASILRQKPEEMALSDEEQKLYDLIMEYRRRQGLPSIALSKSLTYVAKVHCIDLELNFTRGTKCNAHSWSDAGRWVPVCYTPDHKNAALVWSKPSELTEYPGKGYEIAFWKSDYADAASALKGWQDSPLHNNMMINLENWKDNEWNAVGVAIYGRYSCVWFGSEEDPVK